MDVSKELNDNKIKIMIISDVHGSSTRLAEVLEHYKKEAPDYLFILGDILYHGPRNPLPEGYNPKAVIELLNPLQEHIVAVRGNCDSEVDQMVLEFPMRGDYQQLLIEGEKFFLSHGHLFDNDLPSLLSPNTLYVQGHSHVPMIERKNRCWHLNPGSISLPKENHPPTFGMYEDGIFTVRTLDNQIYMKMER